MREDEVKLLQEVFSSVKEYLAYPTELRERVDSMAKTSGDIISFMSDFKKSNSSQENVTRKTDGDILLNQLKRRLS